MLLNTNISAAQIFLLPFVGPSQKSLHTLILQKYFMRWNVKFERGVLLKGGFFISFLFFP